MMPIDLLADEKPSIKPIDLLADEKPSIKPIDLLADDEPIKPPQKITYLDDVSKSMPATTPEGFVDQMLDTDKNIINIGKSFIHGAAQNSLDMGTGTANLANSMGNYLLKTHVPKIHPYKLGGTVTSPTAETAGEYLNPLMYAAPEAKAGKIVEYGEKLLPLIEKSPAFLKGLVSRGLTGGATGAAYSAAFSPDDQKKGAEIGASYGAPLSMALGAPGAMLENQLTKWSKEAALPASHIRSPKAVNKIVTDLKNAGIKVPINFGDLIKSPTLSQFYHETLSNVPFSGARGAGQEVLRQARLKAQELMDGLRSRQDGKIDESKVDTHLVNAVKTSNKKFRGISSALYKRLDERAKKLGISAVPNSVGKVLSDLEDEGTKIKYHLDPESKDMMDEALKKTKDKKLTPLDYKKSRNLIQMFNGKSFENAATGNRRTSRVYSKISKAFSNDLENSIRNSGHKKLNKVLDFVKGYYKDYVAPYNESDIRKIIYKSKNPDKLENVLLKGENLSVTSHLSQEDKNLLAAAKLKRSIKEEVGEKEVTNPFSLINKIDNGLSPKQKEVLFEHTNMKHHVNILRALTQAAKEPSLLEAKRPTGMRTVGRTLQSLPMFLAGGAAFAPAMRPTLLSSLAGITMGTKGLTKLLTSDYLKKAYQEGKLPSAFRNQAFTTPLIKVGALISAKQRAEQEKNKNKRKQ